MKRDHFLGKMGQSRSEAHFQNATFERENILCHLADITCLDRRQQSRIQLSYFKIDAKCLEVGDKADEIH